MGTFYMVLGCIVWNRITEIARCIQNLSDEEFNRVVQGAEPETARIAMTIRCVGRLRE